MKLINTDVRPLGNMFSNPILIGMVINEIASHISTHHLTSGLNHLVISQNMGQRSQVGGQPSEVPPNGTVKQAIRYR